MSKMFRAPTVLRSGATPGRLPPRTFSTTTPSLSALFNLNGLAHSRESQYLSKERGIPRTEYSSNIHLIRSSEVDPFPNAPGASKHANPAQESRRFSQTRTGHLATIIAANKSNETHIRDIHEVPYPTRKMIEELRLQVRAVMDENAQLRAALLQRSDGDNVRIGVPGSLFREFLRVFLFLAGSYAIVSYLWPMAFSKYASEKVDAGVADAPAAAVTRTEVKTEEAMPVDSLEPIMAPQLKLHDPQPSRKSWNPLSFLWA